MSDNTAANLVMDRLGGPEAVNRFLRSTGDKVSPVDRREPDLNTFAASDPRDTTTPAAMGKTLRGLLLDDALSSRSQLQLSEWMSHGGVTGDLLRAMVPTDWSIQDKSGSGSHNRNIIAVLAAPGARAWVVTIFISDGEADFATRNAALREIGDAVIRFIRS